MHVLSVKIIGVVDVAPEETIIEDMTVDMTTDRTTDMMITGIKI